MQRTDENIHDMLYQGVLSGTDNNMSSQKRSQNFTWIYKSYWVLLIKNGGRSHRQLFFKHQFCLNFIICWPKRSNTHSNLSRRAWPWHACCACLICVLDLGIPSMPWYTYYALYRHAGKGDHRPLPSENFFVYHYNGETAWFDILLSLKLLQ